MKRLPVELTADRLIKHYEEFSRIMSSRQRDAWFLVVNGLFEIANIKHWELNHPNQPLKVWE